MLREEAIEVIQKFIGWFKPDSRIYKALKMAIQALSQEPCDEKKDCSNCKYEEYSSNYQPCRDCGTLLESYTNWEQKERELPCIYDLKNRYCPRLNEHGMLKYPLQEQTTPSDDAISRDAAITAINKLYEECEEWRALNDLQYGTNQGLSLAIEVIENLPSVTQKSETVTEFADRCRECGARYGKYRKEAKRWKNKWLKSQKSGKWIELPKALNPNENPCKCSECGHVLSFMNCYPKSKFCPNCGARMESEE